MKSRPYSLPGGFTVTFELTAIGINAEWTPRVPYGRKARRLADFYRAARDEFVQGEARRMGVNAVVIEV